MGERVGAATDSGRALVVSPRGLVRSAVIWVLASLEVTPVECADARSAERSVRGLVPDLVLVDLDVEWDGVCAGGFAQWCARLPGGVRVIALAGAATSAASAPVGCQVLAADAPPAALARLVIWTIRQSACPVGSPALTERQTEVLTLAGRGAKNSETADELLISPGTVKRHLHDAFTTLGARTRVEAIASARAHGLI